MTLLEIFLPLALAGASLHGSPDATTVPVPSATATVTASATTRDEPSATATVPADATATPVVGTSTKVPTFTATATTPAVKQTPAHMRAWTLDDGQSIELHAVYANAGPAPIYVYQPSVEVVDAAGTVLRLDDNAKRAGIPVQPGALYCFVVAESLSDLPETAAAFRLPAGGEAVVAPLPADLAPRYMATPSVQVDRDEIERDGQAYYHRMRAMRTDAGPGPVSVTSIHFDGRDTFQFCTRATKVLDRNVWQDFTVTTSVDLRYSKHHTTSFR